MKSLFYRIDFILSPFKKSVTRGEMTDRIFSLFPWTGFSFPNLTSSIRTAGKLTSAD